jgi:hypothetical protein
MTQTFPLTEPSDIGLLLRAEAEQRWLTHEVLPVIRELERPGVVPEDQHDAAVAYLEVLWHDALERAAETDEAFVELNAWDHGPQRALCERARRYNAAVRRLRGATDARVKRLTYTPKRLPITRGRARD